MSAATNLRGTRSPQPINRRATALGYGQRSMIRPAPTVTYCLEQALGHRTHGQNLETALASRSLSVRVERIEQPASPASHIPWALCGSAAAYGALRRERPRGPVFFHTQTVSLFAPFAARRNPYVVSVDATPLQVDQMGKWYRHRTAPGGVESVKRHWYRQVLRRADAVVSWSEWAADSLVDEYGVSRAKILVAHPGAPAAMFALERRPPQRVTRILFVGGDLKRKGGDTLIRAFRSIRRPGVELVLVTEADVAPEPGVRIEHGVKPGSDRLYEAYRTADLFCLPTLGDCTPVAVEEAMASGLPVITTSVGANTETVVDGETGILVPPANEDALASALRTLIDDPSRRLAMGTAARERAQALLHAERNANRIIDLMESV